MIEKKLENSLYLIGHQPKFHENAEYSFFCESIRDGWGLTPPRSICKNDTVVPEYLDVTGGNPMISQKVRNEINIKNSLDPPYLSGLF